MGKLIDVYRHAKGKDPDKIYMFKGGVFYYFLDEDAKTMNRKYNFKLTSFGDTVKCGFPVKSIEKYLYLFCNENIELINEEEINDKKEKVINIIKNLDLNELTPKDAFIELNSLKELLDD